MGNRISFRYDYLMPNRGFYDITHNHPSLGDGCFAVALPMKGVTCMSKSNINRRDIEQESVFYSYRNAIIHNRGRGFLGFESVNVSQGFTNGKTTLHKRGFSRRHTGSHCSLLLDYDTCIVIPRGDYHRILASVDSYSYTKKVNSRNSKVYMPMVIKQINDHFDIDNNGQFLNRTVSKNSYDGLAHYQNTVHCVKNVQATGLVQGERGLPGHAGRRPGKRTRTLRSLRPLRKEAEHEKSPINETELFVFERCLGLLSAIPRR